MMYLLLASERVSKLMGQVLCKATTSHCAPQFVQNILRLTLSWSLSVVASRC